MINNIAALLVCVALTGCSMAAIMTQERYQGVQIGTPISQVEEQYGEPYDVKTLPNGWLEYRYIERLEVGGGASEQIHYTLRVFEGRVMDKQMQRIGGTVDFRTP